MADGTWREFKKTIQLRDREMLMLGEFSDTYMEEYAKRRNKQSSQIRKRVAFKFLNQFFGNLSLEAVTPAHLHKYVRHRKAHGISDATINREITILKHLLKYAVDCGVIDSNPIEKFKHLREGRRQDPGSARRRSRVSFRL